VRSKRSCRVGHTAQALGRLDRRDEAIPMMLRAVDLFERLEVVMGQTAWLRILGEERYDDDHAAKARESLSRAGHLYVTVGQHDRAACCRAKAEVSAEPDAVAGRRRRSDALHPRLARRASRAGRPGSAPLPRTDGSMGAEAWRFAAAR
jgi:hypothetical protein